jgi:hypothetical protein
LAERRGFGASSVTVYSTASVLHTRLRRGVASSFAIGFSSRSGRSRDRIPDRDARVFRPRSRDTDPSCGMETAMPLRRPRAPCAHRLGERTKRHCLGRMLSSRCLTRQPPGLSCLGRETRDVDLRAGLALANVSLHAPSTDSTFGSAVGQTCSPDTTAKGHASALRPSRTRSTLAARRMTDDPVRVSDLLRRSTPCPRKASRPPSFTSPRCLELRFYNQRFSSRALAETSPSETACRGPWENPPVSTLQIALITAFPPLRGRRRTTLRSSSLQRPRA